MFSYIFEDVLWVDLFRAELIDQYRALEDLILARGGIDQLILDGPGDEGVLDDFASLNSGWKVYETCEFNID